MVTKMGRSDAEIQQAVIRELKWDTRVEETDLGVEVDRGIVTLTGTVSSYGKKLAAAEAAHRVAGVLDVANDVIVQLPGAGIRTDTDIARAVREALEWEVQVPDKEIQSTVTDGWVTLSGTVGSWQQRQEAERSVRNLAGVKGVKNHIEVQVRQRPSTTALQESIEEALERRAERTAKRIRVTTTEGGLVTLRGKVESWEERQAIVGTVGHAPGVREVRDELTYA